MQILCIQKGVFYNTLKLAYQVVMPNGTFMSYKEVHISSTSLQIVWNWYAIFHFLKPLEDAAVLVIMPLCWFFLIPLCNNVIIFQWVKRNNCILFILFY